jgi:hypothetical protein
VKTVDDDDDDDDEYDDVVVGWQPMDDTRFSHSSWLAEEAQTRKIHELGQRPGLLASNSSWNSIVRQSRN